eukprot:gene9407-10390_t
MHDGFQVQEDHIHNPVLKRQRSNEIAWKKLHGYHTTSGCPCWDRTTHPCIPKRTGWGFNPNFFAIFCCFLCLNIEAPADASTPPGEDGKDNLV